MSQPPTPASVSTRPAGRRWRHDGRFVVLVTAMASTAAACGGSGSPATTTTTTAARHAESTTTTGVAAALSTSPPPWPVPADATSYIAEAGLTPAAQETLTVHYHAHLDVIVNGQPVAVPAGLGFVVRNGQAVGVTALHTHDATGVVHVEAPADVPFKLGQLFTEWGVKLDATHLGGLTAGNGNDLRVYVNGTQSATPADQVVFRPHQEVVVLYGPTNAQPQVPSSYSFSAGE